MYPTRLARLFGQWILLIGILSLQCMASSQETEIIQTADIGTFSSLNVPQPTNLNDAVAVQVGRAHVVALKVDGTVVAWGQNSSNQKYLLPDCPMSSQSPQARFIHWH